MWDEPEEVIRALLGPDEELLWAGQPAQGIRLGRSDYFLTLFCWLWFGFAIFWTATAILVNAPLDLVLVGPILALVGLSVVAGRFLVNMRQRSNIYYAVTSDRIVIVSGLFHRQIKSLDIDTVTNISLTERSGGAGTITFGAVSPLFWWSALNGWPLMGQPANIVPTFELAGDALEVFQIIQRARRATK